MTKKHFIFSVTTHSVNNLFERKDNVLATIEIKSEHSGDVIAKLIEECLSKNGLKMSSLIACVRDDAKMQINGC